MNRIRENLFAIAAFVKGDFELSFYGGLKMYDLGDLRIGYQCLFRLLTEHIVRWLK